MEVYNMILKYRNFKIGVTGGMTPTGLNFGRESVEEKWVCIINILKGG